MEEGKHQDLIRAGGIYMQISMQGAWAKKKTCIHVFTYCVTNREIPIYSVSLSAPLSHITEKTDR